eukprot:7971347-Pyramimonas_sp.AAC.1
MCLNISGGLPATPPPGMGCNVFCTLGQQLQADFRRNAALWLKMRSLEEKDSFAPDVVKRRAEPQRQRRLLLRLATSVGTLLRLHLRYPHNPNTRHSFPIPPALALHILKLLSQGTE